MNVSTASWHYRFIDKFSDYRPPGNFCPYMRKLSLFILMFPAGAFGAACLLFLVTAPLWFSFLGSINAISAAVVGGALDIVILNFIWQEYRNGSGTYKNSALHDDLLPGLSLSITKPTFFSLVAAWFSARHDDICPTIFFINDKE